jgi:hypothetical protein
MKTLRHVGTLAFVLGLFTAVFVGMPWYMIVSDDPGALVAQDSCLLPFGGHSCGASDIGPRTNKRQDF